MLKFFFTFLFLILSSNAFSIDLKALSMTQQWKALGHYEKVLIGYQSSISSPQFFVAANGSTQPLEELKATIFLFNQGPADAFCKYPARYLFLRQKQLVREINFTAECNEYREYVTDLPVKQISLVYASGFLGNPASMFGHLLLRLDLGQSSALLDNTFNFGAIVPPQDNKLTYIAKGVSGGYVSRFSDEPFYHHSNVYNEDELRNIWEYSLALTPDQISLLLAHRFELQNELFDYYFFTENCAYQLAVLLELVTDQPILASKYPWVLPIDVITALNDSSPSIIRSYQREPSRQQKFYDRFNQLSKSSQIAANEFIDGQETLENIVASFKDEIEKKRFIEVMLDYFSYLEIRQKSLTVQQTAQRQSLLMARFAMQTGAAEWDNITVLAPHQTQRPSMLRVAHVQHETEPETQLIIKGSYYDELSINEPENNFSALETMNFAFSDAEPHIFKSLDLVNIRNIKPDSTLVMGDESYAWSFKFGYQPAEEQCTDCGVGYISGGIGKAFGDLQNSIYGMVTTRIQSNYLDTENVFVGVELGWITKPVDYWRSKVVLQSERGINGSNTTDTMRWEQAFGSSIHRDVRAAVDVSSESKFSISTGYYW